MKASFKGGHDHVTIHQSLHGLRIQAAVWRRGEQRTFDRLPKLVITGKRLLPSSATIEKVAHVIDDRIEFSRPGRPIKIVMAI